jgi:hypothetical protein
MSNKKLPAIDPEKNYRVYLSRPVQIAATLWAHPRDHVVMRGDVLESHKGDADRYEEV